MNQCRAVSYSIQKSFLRFPMKLFDIRLHNSIHRLTSHAGISSIANFVRVRFLHRLLRKRINPKDVTPSIILRFREYNHINKEDHHLRLSREGIRNY